MKTIDLNPRPTLHIFLLVVAALLTFAVLAAGCATLSSMPTQEEAQAALPAIQALNAEIAKLELQINDPSVHPFWRALAEAALAEKVQELRDLEAALEGIAGGSE